MFEKVLDDLQSGSGRRREEAVEIVLSRSKQKSKISDDKFIQISNSVFSGKACFVDGGNAPIYESPENRVELVRLYATIYKGKKRVATKREEGFVLVQSVTKGGEEFIEAKAYAPLDLQLTISATDDELKIGNERVTLGTVTNLCRFILECRFALRVAKENECELLVRDGSLEGINSYEEVELKELLREMKNVVGFSKTTTLLTADGRSAVTTLFERGPKGLWLYNIKGEKGAVEKKYEMKERGKDDNRMELMVVKLHELSEHAFRVDVKGDKTTEIVSFLASVSSDPVFVGYPYPLIEADRMARVTNKEMESAKMRFKAEAGAEWRSLKLRSRGSDAHEILDGIS